MTNRCTPSLMSFGSSDPNRPCPSTVANGLALTPTLHKLFDHGAWSLDDSRRVIVSRHFSGSDVAPGELRALEGKPYHSPASGYAPYDPTHIRRRSKPKYPQKVKP